MGDARDGDDRNNDSGHETGDDDDGSSGGGTSLTLYWQSFSPASVASSSIPQGRTLTVPTAFSYWENFGGALDLNVQYEFIEVSENDNDIATANMIGLIVMDESLNFIEDTGESEDLIVNGLDEYYRDADMTIEKMREKTFVCGEEDMRTNEGIKTCAREGLFRDNNRIRCFACGWRRRYVDIFPLQSSNLHMTFVDEHRRTRTNQCLMLEPECSNVPVCHICMDHPVRFALDPCGHAAYCLSCVTKLKNKCAECRHNIERVVKIKY